MAPEADLYFSRMDLEKYCRGETCELCRVNRFSEFVERLKKGELKSGACPHWPESRLEAFRLAVSGEEFIPPVPMLEFPRPAEAGLLDLMPGDELSPLIITGNSEFTQAVMLAVLATARKPVRLLSVDCQGHTVDMAMIFKALTAPRIAGAFAEFEVSAGPERKRVVLPGLAASLAPELSSLLSRPVEVGPVCAAELPLFMGEDWGF